VAAATRNFMSLELHSVDVPWWGELVMPALSYEGGFIKVPDRPGLGIDGLNERLIKRQSCADVPPPWASTKEWDREWANDRCWS
jgi:L-alanine-DL-glutamate epimerase-like enolase superfamily enzyme